MKLKTYILLLAIFVLSPLALYFGYKLYRDYEIEMAYQESVAPFREAYERSAAYLKEADRIERKYKAMLKADHYGGKTPEETLDLFVDALKKRDYKLAAKYYLPWKQKEAEQYIKKWIKEYNYGLQEFIRSYEDGVIKIDDDKFTGVDIEVYSSTDEQYPYIIEMTKNEINNIWKIEKF